MKTEIMTKDNLNIYDKEMKAYIKSQGIGLNENDVNDLIDTKLVPINNNKMDNKTFKAGNNVTITENGDEITILSTDTKNTTGSSNTSSKIYLVGAINQENNPVTYSHDTAYVGTDGCIYSNNTRVSTEAITTSEPNNQVAGDYWMLAY